MTTAPRTFRVAYLPRDRTWIVAVSAALWGLDALLRKPLATNLQPATIVLWEHVIVVAVVAAWIPGAVRAYLRCPPTHQVAIALIGIGASAVATALFTEAFEISARSGDFVTPLVLQKLQPLFAVALAVLVLRERLRPRFACYALPALAGVWLLSFANPLEVRIAVVKVALLALGAAALWGAGTVLGRMVSTSVTPLELTVLRHVWGLPAAFVVAEQTDSALTPGWHNMFAIVLLALIPGLAALSLYYYGLRATPASRATFAELAFPATAAFIGVAFLGSHLRTSQWLGMAIVVASVTALGWHERATDRTSVLPGPVAPELADATGYPMRPPQARA
ncbi:MAG: DMT family transporter [Jatrophihabitantaceae bacterium]